MAAVLLFALIIGMTILLAYLERPEHGPRYSGLVYDPQPRAIRRAGAVPK